MPKDARSKLENKNILKSIIEQKLLRLSREMKHTFHYFPKRTHKGIMGLAPKKYISLYLEVRKLFFNCRAKHV